MSAFVGVDEVAIALGCSRRTAQRYAQEIEGARRGPGGCWLVPIEALEQQASCPTSDSPPILAAIDALRREMRAEIELLRAELRTDRCRECPTPDNCCSTLDEDPAG